MKGCINSRSKQKKDTLHEYTYLRNKQKKDTLHEYTYL